jgi:tetratricopeptide (TPR) repeat protein
MIKRAHGTAAWFFVACLGACGGEPESETAGQHAVATAGGEAAMAREMPAAEVPSDTAGTTESDASEAEAALAPMAAPMGPPPLVESAQSALRPPPEGQPSPWGAPDAESGRALPQRAAMGRKAKRAFDKGVEAARRFDHRSAGTHFEGALAENPRAFEAQYNLGVVSDREGRTNVALQHYRKALEIQPDYERAVEGIVRIHLRNGSSSAALAEVEPVAKTWERNLYLQAILAEVLVAVGRIDEAEKAARRALQRDERFVPAMVALAKASLARGRGELAASILEQASAIDGNDPEIQYLQGRAYQTQGRLLDALNSYRRAVELRPEYAEARMALGIQYLAAGNYADALRQFEVTVRLVPTLVAAHLNLGDAYRATKEWQKAKNAFDNALRMQDPLPQAHFNLGLMYMSAGGGFPQMDTLAALGRATVEFSTYREQMGSRLSRDDPSAGYIADLQRQIEREKKRIEREERRKQQERDRAKDAGG